MTILNVTSFSFLATNLRNQSSAQIKGTIPSILQFELEIKCEGNPLVLKCDPWLPRITSLEKMKHSTVEPIIQQYWPLGNNLAEE